MKRITTSRLNSLISWFTWITYLFRTIPTIKQAKEMGLKFHENIYGVGIVQLNCRSIWTDSFMRQYHCDELVSPNIYVDPIEQTLD